MAPFQIDHIIARQHGGETVFDKWRRHFFWDGPELKALTDIGSVAISVLLINDPGVIAVRRALLEEGVFGA
jgi:hypothetical protein